MFPASWRLFRVSKSNSSTLFPSTTTTRVSSAWVASMSIFLDMVFQCRAALRGPVARCQCGTDQETGGVFGRGAAHAKARLCPIGSPRLSPMLTRASSRFSSRPRTGPNEIPANQRLSGQLSGLATDPTDRRFGADKRRQSRWSENACAKLIAWRHLRAKGGQIQWPISA